MEYVNTKCFCTLLQQVAKYSDPKEACAAIVAESYPLWLQFETRTDDITIIFVHIDNLDDVNIAIEPYYRESPMMPIKVETKSPLRSNRDVFKGSRPVRQDFSRAKARAIEASLDPDGPWVPANEPHIKTPEEEAQLKQALQGNFLFQSLTEKQ